MIYNRKFNDHSIVDHMSDILDDYEYGIYKQDPSELFSDRVLVRINGISKDLYSIKNKVMYSMLNIIYDNIIYDNMENTYGFTKNEIINITKSFNDEINMIKSIKNFEDFNLVKISISGFENITDENFILNLFFDPNV